MSQPLFNRNSSDSRQLLSNLFRCRSDACHPSPERPLSQVFVFLHWRPGLHEAKRFLEAFAAALAHDLERCAAIQAVMARELYLRVTES